VSESINPVVEFLAKLRKDLDDVIERLEKIEKRENKGADELFKEINKSLGSKGYGGDWLGNEGKLSVLHEKELVLNKEDTKEILNRVIEEYHKGRPTKTHEEKMQEFDEEIENYEKMIHEKLKQLDEESETCTFGEPIKHK
jgi:hypothetical protein